MVVEESRIIPVSRHRALHAMKYVNTAIEQGLADFSSYAKKSPEMVMVNGLCPYIAFVKGKKEKKDKEKKDRGYKLIEECIAGWLKKQGFLRNEENILEELLTLSPAQYRYATTEVIELLGWLKRLCEAKMGDSDVGEEAEV
jgi:CRISPR type III-B/RAMP module-associated protein Cmr5